MARNVSNTLTVSKLVLSFVVLFFLQACQKGVTNPSEQSEMHQDSLKSTSTMSNGSGWDVYHVVEDGGALALQAHKFDVHGDTTQAQINHVFKTLQDSAPTELRVFYEPLKECQCVFIYNKGAYLNCPSLRRGDLGFAQEQKILLGLLKTLLAFGDVAHVVFLDQGRQARVFGHQLVLPDRLNHDLIKILETQLSMSNNHVQ